MPGIYNFRPKETDFNGNYEYYELSKKVIIEIPETGTLSQNYPNPFNPDSRISFEIGGGIKGKV